MSTEPRRWRMHAARDTHHGGFQNFGHPRYVEMHGHTEVIPVELTEDPNGPYYGWLRIGETQPCMIQQHPGIYRMQFAYGPAIEEERGMGETVRMTAAEITEED